MNRRRLLMIALVGSLGITSILAVKSEERLFIDTHELAGRPDPIDDSGGASMQHGIYGVRLNTLSGHFSSAKLALELERATRLVVHPSLPVLYSVAGDLQPNSYLHAFSIDRHSGTLTQLSKVAADGRDAMHPDFDRVTSSLFSANDGSVSASFLSVCLDGTLGPVRSTQSETRSDAARQPKTAATHGVAVNPTHFFVLVADRGANHVFIYRLNSATRTLSPDEVLSEPLSAESGPRHLLFHPNGRMQYVDNELTDEIRTYRWTADGRLTLAQTVSPYPDGFAGEKVVVKS